MSAKERKSIINKDMHVEKEMSPRLRGRVTPNSESSSTITKRRTVRGKKADSVNANEQGRSPEPSPVSPTVRVKKEKESDATFLVIDSISLLKPKPDEDTLSVRSLTSMRTRKSVVDTDDEVASLRSVSTKRDDDDASSVRSLSIRRNAKAAAAVDVKRKGPIKRKKEQGKAEKQMKKLKPRDLKRNPKKPIRFQNKIVDVKQMKRSNALIKKKVQKAQDTVKRAKKQAVANGVIIKNRPVKQQKCLKKQKSKVELSKQAKNERKKKVAPSGGAVVLGKRKRAWDKNIHFETTQSLEDSSVIIVQPRLGPKMRKLIKQEVEENAVATSTSTAVPKTSPGMPSPTSASTPYLIQSMPNFSMVNPPSNIPGEVLVTPTGIVLIKALTTTEQRNVRIEKNSEPKSVSLTTVMSPNALTATTPTPDSILSEEAKEAEPTSQEDDVDKSLHVSTAAMTEEGASSLNGKMIKPMKKAQLLASPVAERRASHEERRPPSRKLPRRSGSCERLLNDKRQPNTVPPLLPLPSVLNVVSQSIPEEEENDKVNVIDEKEVDSGISEDSAPPRTDSNAAAEDEECSVSAEDPSQIADQRTDVDVNKVIALPAPPVPINANMELQDSTPSERWPSKSEISITPMAVFSARNSSKNPKIVSRTRTKKYSRSVEAKEKQLLDTVRRRSSHPETQVINIVTCQDGSKQGKNLIAELCEKAMLSPNDILGNSVENSHSNNRDVPYLSPVEAKLSPNKICPAVTMNTLPPKTNLVQNKKQSIKKEMFLGALGLYKLEAVAEMQAARAKRRKESQEQQQHQQSSLLPHQQPSSSSSNGSNSYTGTLKTVIKIQRPEKRGNGKMIYRASSSSVHVENGHAGPGDETDYLQNNDTNDKENDNLSEEDIEVGGPSQAATSTGKTAGGGGSGGNKTLVIPEKASSFSIHPHRMCSDVCTYCFGKFGLLDTPCHIAQLKGQERRAKILATEVHLTADSCLCDACFRHVDKKSNQANQHDRPRRKLLDQQQKSRCAVEHCNFEGCFSFRRKLILKLKKSIGRKLVFDPKKLDRPSGSSIIWICTEHNKIIEFYLSCAICKKRLIGMNMHRVGSSVHDINRILTIDEIPTSVSEKRFLCKLCQFYTTIRLRDPKEMSQSHRQYYETCRKRILRSYEMDSLMNSKEGNMEFDADVPRNNKNSKQKKTASNKSAHTTASADDTEPESESSAESEPIIKKGSNNNNKAHNKNSQQQDHINQPTSAAEVEDEDVNVHARFRMHPESDSGGFQKCTTTIQFSGTTKNMFYDLQRPYGNHSSFFRHLIYLEKYFRSGDLVLAPNADPAAAKYLHGVYNRLRSYEGLPQVEAIPKSLSHSNPPPPPPPPNMSPPPLAIIPLPPSNPISQIEATVQSIGINKPEISISTVPSSSSCASSSSCSTPSIALLTSLSPGNNGDLSQPIIVPAVTLIPTTSNSAPTKLTPKLQENLRVLANKANRPAVVSKTMTPITPSAKNAQSASPTRAIILNRTVGGHKQSFVQVTTGGKTIHLTLSQFRRIQQMQLRKKQYMEQQAKLLKLKEQQQQEQQRQVNGGSGLSLPKALKITLKPAPASNISASPVDLDVNDIETNSAKQHSSS